MAFDWGVARREVWGAVETKPAASSKPPSGSAFGDRSALTESIWGCPGSVDGQGTWLSRGSVDGSGLGLDRGWRERHIRGQADGTLPPGTIQMRHADGRLVFDRLGRPRMWSMHVAAATVPGRPSSRARAKAQERAAETARAAMAGRALQAQVQPSLIPPHGRLFAVDIAALLLSGPSGGIGTTERVVRTLRPLAGGGRHPVTVLVQAGGWVEEDALGAALRGLAPKLAAIGLRLCWRKAGIRMAKLKPTP